MPKGNYQKKQEPEKKEEYRDHPVFSYITTEEAAFKTTRIPLTTSKDWNMHEHIERCTNVANAWFHTGKNDGTRPYMDIVTPIINVAFRSEGFDVKDIVPYVDDKDNYYKSFLVKKFHPQWARTNKLDTFIDEVAESSIIYDLVLVKNVNETRPEVVPLQSIAFCDQTDVLSGPICIKHQYTVPDMYSFKGKWDDDSINQAVLMAKSEKKVSSAGDQAAKTPGKYSEVYELHGDFPETWLDEDGDSTKYVPQMHIVTFYTNEQGKKNGICLYKGKEAKSIFRALKIDMVRSYGRACGRSIVESLFDPQVWTNYDAIKIKEMLDSAINLFQTDSEEFGDQKLKDLKQNTIIKHEVGKPITKIDSQILNLTPFTNHMTTMENNARTIGSASDAQLGTNPVAGTPFALQSLVVQQGEGIHEYRQGKIATFFADTLYPDWIIGYLVDEMNNGKEFSEELSLDEMSEIAEKVSSNVVEERIKQSIMETGIVPTNQERDAMKDAISERIMKSGNRQFFQVIKDELSDLPVKVFINIKGKQKDMAKTADSITNIIREVIKNPEAFRSYPGIGKAFNEVLENSGLSPIDFSQVTRSLPAPTVAPESAAQPLPAEQPVAA